MHKVLIVDDLTSDIKLVMECLKDEYQLSAATSGEKAIEMAEHNHPDVILMDVSMPNMSGYDACKQILKRQHANIIFLSANDSTDEILRGYDAGGIDYIIKPFDPVILKEKISYAIGREPQTPDTALANDSDQIAHAKWLAAFVQACKNLEHPQALAKTLIEELKLINCRACVQFHSELGIIEAGHQGSLSRLESEILTRQLQEEGHYFEGAQGLFITYDSVALLVKNPPDSFEQLESLKQLLAAVAQATAALLHLQDKYNQQVSSPPSTPTAGGAEALGFLAELEAAWQNEMNRAQISTQVIESVLAQLEESFVDLGLTFNQEQLLLSILHKGVDQSVAFYEQGMSDNQQILSRIQEQRSKLSQ